MMMLLFLMIVAVMTCQGRFLVYGLALQRSSTWTRPPVGASRQPISTMTTMSTTTITTPSKVLPDDSQSHCQTNNIINDNNRRRLLSSLVAAAAPSTTGGLSHALAADDDELSNDDDDNDTTRIYQLKSGVQFRNVRMGNGPPVTADTTVVLHLQALLRNGRVLLDTRATANGTGQPIVYTLGSALSSPAPWLIPPGLDDALVSRGVTTTGQRVPPMRQGGVRLVVIPAALGYGSAGLSRYQAWQLSNGSTTSSSSTVTVREPVPRDEMLRYEVEVLRCIDVPINNGDDGASSSRTIQACCSEEVYPCRTPGGQ